MKRLSLLWLLLALLLPLQAHAQSVWTAPYRSDGITFEGYKPNFDQVFDDATGASFPSSAWFLSANYSIVPSLRLGAELGLSHYGFDEDVMGFTDNETSLSNLLVNAEWMSPVENLSAVVGVRIPTASDNGGGLTGSVVDIERVHAFSPDVWTVLAEGDYRLPVTDNVRLHLSGGPIMMIDTFFEDTETDLLARYGAQGWYEAARYMVGAGVIGVSNLTMDSEQIAGDRTNLAIGGSFSAKLPRVQPGINFQVPVTDTYSDLVDWVVGVSLRVPF